MLTAKEKQVSEGLLRQRRNLIICCVLLWLMKYGGVALSKFSIAGFDVSFKKPEALFLSLWIAFAYFLWRYYQYFFAEGEAKLRNVFEALCDVKCKPIIASLVESEHPDNTNKGYSYTTLRSWGWTYTVQKYISDEFGRNQLQSLQQPIKRSEFYKAMAAAAIETVLRDSVVTDYLLPFFIAGFVLWYCGSNDWDGSFLKFIFP